MRSLKGKLVLCIAVLLVAGTSGVVQAADKPEAERPEADKPELPDKKAKPAKKDDLVAKDPTAFMVPTLNGGGGLFRLHTAYVGRPFDIRFGIHFEYFKENSFIVDNWAGCGAQCPDETNSRMQGAVTVGFTPYKYIEAFAALYSSANRNDRRHQALNAGERNPNETPLQMALGDFMLGVKGAFPVMANELLSVGALGGVKFLTSHGELKPDFGATNLHFAALLSADFRRLHPLALVRAHLNVGYVYDRSMKLIDGDMYKDPTASSEYHHYYLVQQFALGMNTSRVRIGFGLDAMLPYLATALSDMKYMRWFPEVIFELGMDIATSSPDSDIKEWQEFASDSDYNVNGKLATRISTGLRFKPIAGLHMDIGVDVALTHFGFAVGPALPPWNLFFQAGYTFSPLGSRVVVKKVETKPKTVVKYIEKKPEPTEGRVRGVVIDSKTKAPLAAAIVTFVGKAVSDVATAEDGSFMSFQFKEGKVRLEVRKEGYHPWTGEVEIKAGKVSKVDVALVPEPPKVGTLVGSVVSAKGNKQIAAKVSLTGPESKEISVGSDGAFNAKLKPGTYKYEANAPEHFKAQGSVALEAGQKQLLEIKLTHRPKRLLVVVTKRKIRIRKKVHFATGKAEIRPDSTQLLSQVAGVIIEHPEIKKIRIEGHTDNRGSSRYNRKLSQKRAESVMEYLINKGVSPDRLQAKGYGESRPIRPNFSARNRRKNRRVEFRILKREGGRRRRRRRRR
jgi:outer membrane protein OmpA-like peptidoglycan-associated protein